MKFLIFKKEFLLAYKYLKINHASEILDKVNALPQDVFIVPTTGITHYNPDKNTVYWNPTMGITTNEMYDMTPAEAVSHEFDHAFRDLTDAFGLITDLFTEDKDYDNKEDKRVIKGSEQNVARKLGRIKKDQVTRKDHSGLGVTKTKNSISSDDINTVSVSAKKNKK